MVKNVSPYFLSNFLSIDYTMYNLTLDEMKSGGLNAVRNATSVSLGPTMTKYVNDSFKKAYKLYIDAVLRQYCKVVDEKTGVKILDNSSYLGNPHGRQLAADPRWRVNHLQGNTTLQSWLSIVNYLMFGVNSMFIPSLYEEIDLSNEQTTEALSKVAGEFVTRLPDGKIPHEAFKGCNDAGTIKNSIEVL